jgi:hypothetical protein
MATSHAARPKEKENQQPNEALDSTPPVVTTPMSTKRGSVSAFGNSAPSDEDRDIKKRRSPNDNEEERENHSTAQNTQAPSSFGLNAPTGMPPCSIQATGTPSKTADETLPFGVLADFSDSDGGAAVSGPAPAPPGNAPTFGVMPAPAGPAQSFTFGSTPAASSTGASIIFGASPAASAMAPAPLASTFVFGGTSSGGGSPAAPAAPTVFGTTAPPPPSQGFSFGCPPISVPDAVVFSIGSGGGGGQSAASTRRRRKGTAKRLPGSNGR